MPVPVEIPGVGLVEFPDEMGADEIEAAAARISAEHAGQARASVSASVPPPAPPEPRTPYDAVMGPPRSYGEALANPYRPGTQLAMLEGGAKSVLGTVAGLGNAADAAGAALGIGGRDAKAFEGVRAMAEPANPGESVGKLAGDTAQFFLLPGPGKVQGALRALGVAGEGTVKALALAGEAAANASLAGAQGSGAGGMALAGAGPLAGAAVSRSLAPLAGELDAGVGAAAERLGVELPASALSKSRVAPVAEAVSVGGFGGGATKGRYEKAGNVLTALADHTVARASNLTDDAARGVAVATGLKQFKARWIKEKNRLYDAVSKELPGLTIKAPQTVALLDQILADKAAAATVLKGGPSTDVAFFKGLRDGLAGKKGALKEVPAEALRAAMRAINDKAGAFSDPFVAAHKGLLKKVAATLDEEFVAALPPAAAGKLQQANQVYANGIGKINATYGKTIHGHAKAGRYDLITKAVANPRMSAEDIPRILEVAGKEGAEAIQASVLADLFTKGKSGPQGLTRALASWGDDRLARLLTPEQLAKVRDMATVTSAMGRGEKVVHGSPTAEKARMMAYPATAVAGFFQPQLLLGLLGDVAFNRFIGSPLGQKWLTTGVPLAAEIGSTVSGAAALGAAGMAQSSNRASISGRAR